MFLPEALRNWLDTAIAQMRWRRARPVAAQELHHHLEDQMQALRAEGISEEEAVRRTLQDMGDAVAVGTELDHAYRPQPDWKMLGMILAVSLVGLALQYFAIMSAPLNVPLVGYWRDGDLLIRQTVTFLWGAACLAIGYFSDFTWPARHWRATFLGAFLIVIGVTLTSPIYLGRPYHLPYILMFAPLLFTIMIYYLRKHGVYGVLCCEAALAVFLVFGVYNTLLQHTIQLIAVCILLLFYAIYEGAFGAHRKKLAATAAIPCIIGMAAIGVAIGRDSFIHRLKIFFNPVSKYNTEGWNMSCVREALYTGSIPSDLHDSAVEFISRASWGEYLLCWLKLNWGWLAFIGAVILITMVLMRGFVLANRQSGMLARLTALAVVLTMTVQTAAYIASNLGFYFDSLGLPLLSHGRIFHSIIMLQLGLLLSVSRTGKLYASSWEADKMMMLPPAGRWQRALNAFCQELCGSREINK